MTSTTVPIPNAVLSMYLTWNTVAEQYPLIFKKAVLPPVGYSRELKVDFAPASCMAQWVSRNTWWKDHWLTLLRYLMSFERVGSPLELRYFFEKDKIGRFWIDRQLDTLFVNRIIADWNRHVDECGGYLERERLSQALSRDILAFFRTEPNSLELWRTFLAWVKQNRLFNGKESMNPYTDWGASQTMEAAQWTPNLRSIFRRRKDKPTILYTAIYENVFDVWNEESFQQKIVADCAQAQVNCTDGI